ESRTVTNDKGFSLPMERTLLVLLLIGFFTWLVFAATGYAARHSQLSEEWSVGSTRLVEVTVVAEDRRRLACASDLPIGSLHCGYLANGKRREPPEDEANTLQPLNTVKSELFLGAGLWSDPGLPVPSMGVRFSVVCNYHVEGVLKSAALRWAYQGPFDPLKQTITAGRFTDCVIPR
ncbi:MAG TPA: hypothetical protein VF395_11465, partial [Polyangiaceae bacterium]